MNNMKDKTKKFIEKATEIHGNKYNYTKVEYKKHNTKVCIICPEHGEFWQTPDTHVHGCGCPQCGRNRTNNHNKYNTLSFTEKAKLIHKDKYDYSKANYVNSRTRVCIICPEHGEFWQAPDVHLQGRGCGKCAKLRKIKIFSSTKEQFIEKAKLTHKDKYDYSKLEYTNAKTKVCIICPKHGEFWQIPDAHIRGNGCPQCGNEMKRKAKTLNTEDFIAKVSIIHKHKYDYSKSEYVNAKEKIKIICPEHGEFWQTPDAHMHGSGCQKCANVLSRPELDIYNFLTNELKLTVEQRCRNIIPPYELDLYIPEMKMGIEYNGLYWHCDKFQKENLHILNKTNMCNNQGIKLIQIFEDEWLNKKDIVLTKLKHILKLSNGEKIMARKTIIKKIEKKDGDNFLEQFHIQGSGIASLYYGAYFNEKLIGVMSFKQNSKNNWELTRFATDYNYVCNGIGGKIFKHFLTQISPNMVKTFADKRWTLNEENNLYTHIGFNYSETIPPTYWYIKENIALRYHKFNMRKKNMLKRYGEKYQLNENMSEHEMAKKIGIYRIYDCGLLKYVWKNLGV